MTDKPFRRAHPLVYASISGATALIVTTVLDMMLFAHSLGLSVRTGLRSGITWFVVMLALVLVAKRMRDID